MNQPLIVIIGMGPGIGSAVAMRFGREGFGVAMIARGEDRLREHERALAGAGVDASHAMADVGDADALARALSEIEESRGPASVLLYNAAHIKCKSILDETAASLLDDFRVNVAGAMTAVRAVLPAMRRADRGTILLTGSMFATRPVAQFGSLSIGKAGIRSLAFMLAGSLKGTGIHVATVTVAGQIRADDPQRSPQAIAEACWRLHQQQPGEFATEVEC